MKASITKSIFAPVLIVLGLTSLFMFQNCSKDVGFDSRPSAVNDAPIVDPTNGGQGTGVPGPTTNGDVVIQFNETPSDTTVDDGSQVVDYTTSTPNGEIVSVVCTLNGVAVACDPTDRITIPPSATGVGPNTFTVVATDTTGQTSQETVTWTVYNAIVPATKVINVTSTADQVDIIINVDNSGSMEYEQTQMANKVANFMAPFAGLDYHIAVTTTSPIGDSTTWHSGLDYVDGKFVELEPGNHCIRSSEKTLAQAQALISANVRRDLYLRDAAGNPVVNPNTGFARPEGNGWERGIFTTYRSFERAVSAGSNANCLRAGVPKHVILISDERETLKEEFGTLLSNGTIVTTFGNDLADQNKSDGGNLRTLVSNIFGASTTFKFHSIIVDPDTDEGRQCLNSYGAKFGYEYAQLSKDTGGYIGSVCAADYSTQLGAIGQIISDSALSYQLDCVAVPNNGNYGSVSGGSVPAHTFNGDKVEFATLPGTGTYTVNYWCFQ